MSEEMDDELYKTITGLCDQGNELCDEEKYAAALEPFGEALALIPRPLENWEASTWVLAALGDCSFLTGNYEKAREYLAMAMHCPGALGNPFIHLRLGQAQYELKNMDRAADELMRAYMGEGEEFFSDEDPKYLAFLRTRMK